VLVAVVVALVMVLVMVEAAQKLPLLRLGVMGREGLREAGWEAGGGRR